MIDRTGQVWTFGGSLWLILGHLQERTCCDLAWRVVDLQDGCRGWLGEDLAEPLEIMSEAERIV